MSIKIKFIVPQEYDGRLVKEYLRGKCMVSATLLTQLKRIENGITNNGNHTRVIDKVQVNDIVEISLPEDRNDIEPVDIPINVLFEDEHVIVIDKEPYRAVHPVHGHIDDTLANACAYYAGQKGETWTFRAVNRLDRDTSGAVLIAKNMYSAPILSSTAKKKYIADATEFKKIYRLEVRMSSYKEVRKTLGQVTMNDVDLYCRLTDENTLVKWVGARGFKEEYRVFSIDEVVCDEEYGGVEIIKVPIGTVLDI